MNSFVVIKADNVFKNTSFCLLTSFIVFMENQFSLNDGIYHVSNLGACSWFEFARFIFLESGYDPSLVKPVSTKEYGAISERPKFSIMSNEALINEGIKPLRP
ncbi:hypothetical protein BKP45_13200 [Anaerobacillus alkalidiazotrophicus]|uniref:RmlD-like substrate binding domain-containing protein n=1 Tax=Anaerobacillus alkalidiazotrophicus TaxID=472963 RepID=A0A1S2M5W1_9BACI|nr:sugar nucleotide-binding protein [Anaerobacillus alkalidiazotrophicus]OIJ18517.1 hypothetical protein BKP45_18915 [Anaerobacillus alkalidiazotrophicus]OIJ19996.1 hypothetical protein BKP45_13200 [Anaerobacillus alkalidiazotrophicus]